MDASELLSRWDLVRHGLIDALGRIDEAQLSFTPREGLWSLGRTAAHIAETEEGWLRRATPGAPAGWPTYPPQLYATVADLLAVLDRVHTHTADHLSRAGSAEWGRIVTLPWGERLAVGDIAWHVLQHEIHHRGEIYLMLGLQGLEAPDV